MLAWNSSAEWVIELQALPPADVIDQGLRSLQPAGNTDIRDSLADAAEALIASDAELKHIILFTDGFTAPGAIAGHGRGGRPAVRGARHHGVGAGHRASRREQAALENIATSGHGRFYAGTDFENVPQIMAEEAVIASRNFITEGEFLPEVTSDDEVVVRADRVAAAARLRRHDGQGPGDDAAAHRPRPRPAARHVAGRARPGDELDERRQQLGRRSGRAGTASSTSSPAS